ncbi:hypothetical protein [Streptomyces sp. NPDC056600]|uniref:hypothetical protein n=1 Tax=Streptomyces sp. NPDC056600 TaxID=3345874 RepID=UPI003679E9A4
MIYRHFIAPTRGYTAFSNAIIRHPRLSSDACRLLTWQLSLPPEARECLSRTAERCGIGASAFTKAKRQLMAEGFVHERRVQAAKGRWATQQLVSCVPLGAAEAVKIMAGLPLPVGAEGTARVFSQVAPSGRVPAVGGPGGRPADGLPSRDDCVEKTSHRPSPAEAGGSAAAADEPGVEAEPSGLEPSWEGTERGPEPLPESGPEPDAEPKPAAEPESRSEWAAEADRNPDPEREPRPEPHPAPDALGAPELHAQARELVESLPRLTPDLRGVPVGMRRELTGLVLRWLEAGHSTGDIRTHLLRGMPSDGSPVLRPGGLVRYLLREVPPVWPPTPAAVDSDRRDAMPPLPAAVDTDLRECEGEHYSVTVFRPTGDETLCGPCLRERACAGGEFAETGPLPAF